MTSPHLPRALRRRATEAETRLWAHLRDRRLEHAKFRRQHRIGPHITDFACEAARLVVECDGGQHRPETDAPRTAALEAAGWRVLRFWNNDVLANTEGVLEEIRHTLRTAQPLTKPD